MFSMVFFVLMIFGIVHAENTYESDYVGGDLITQIEMRYQNLHIQIFTDSYNGADITYTGTQRSAESHAYVFFGDDDDLLICDLEAYFFYHFKDDKIQLLDFRRYSPKGYLVDAVHANRPFSFTGRSNVFLEYSRFGSLRHGETNDRNHHISIIWDDFPEETVASHKPYVDAARLEHSKSQLKSSKAKNNSWFQEFLRNDHHVPVLGILGILCVIIFINTMRERAAQEEEERKRREEQRIKDIENRKVRKRQDALRKARWAREQQQREEEKREKARIRELWRQEAFRTGVDICLHCGLRNPQRCCRCHECVKCSSTDSVFNVRELNNYTESQCHGCDAWDDD
jgi:hypothetical protein